MSVIVDRVHAIRNVDKNGRPLDLDTIYITAGGYINYAFKGVSRDSLLGIDETVWGGDLSRTRGTFSLDNIDQVDFGIVPRCEISFKYMNVHDYLVLCEMAKERVMTVNFFNRDLGERQILEMAMTNQERGNLYNYGKSEYIGNLDIKIKLVATNREKTEMKDQELTVSYNANGASGTAPETQKAHWSEYLKISEPTNLVKSGYSFKEWNTKADGTGSSYGANQGKTLWFDLTLYAIWESANGNS